MHSFLVVGKNKEEREKEIQKLISQKKLKALDFEIKKIADVRDLGSFLKLQINTPTAIILTDIDHASTETLNALLKILEEPQENIKFILSANSTQSILPTISSRCQIINLKGLKPITKDTDKLIKTFISFSTAEKLKEIEKIRKSEDAILFMENYILVGHTILHSNEVDKTILAKSLKYAQKTFLNLKMNGNVVLQLTNFVVNSPSIASPNKV